ncbi:MAG: TMEM165/GDT1 family protein [Formosimonas sp.]
MNAFFISTGLVTLAEIGDKTQLLAFLLAAKFKKPVPIILGILLATLINHAGAGWLGTWLTHLASPHILRWVIGVSFIAMAVWILIPDRMDDDTQLAPYGVFVTTLVAFFLAEMGDKTQIATIGLAAKYNEFAPVVLGTTLGMMLANAPAVLFGDKLAQVVEPKVIHRICAVIFALLGLATLTGLGSQLGL